MVVVMTVPGLRALATHSQRSGTDMVQSVWIIIVRFYRLPAYIIVQSCNLSLKSTIRAINR